MNAKRHIVVHPDLPATAAAVAARLITAILDAQATRGEATVVLTGGTLGIASLKAVADSPALAAVDWSRVNFYWGDERFVEAGSPDRNAVQAEVLLSVLDGHGLDRGRVHAMGSTDEFATPEDAAAAYAAVLAAEAANEGGIDPAGLRRADAGHGPGFARGLALPGPRGGRDQPARPSSGCTTPPSRRRCASR